LYAKTGRCLFKARQVRATGIPSIDLDIDRLDQLLQRRILAVELGLEFLGCCRRDDFAAAGRLLLPE